MKKIQIFIIIFLIFMILIWIKFFFWDYIYKCNFEKAGQLGDSFGFFNSIALIILSFTPFYQIKEYDANRKEMKENIEINNLILRNELKYSNQSKIHETLLKEFDRYNDLYLKYLTMFEEINAGKTHLIQREKLNDLVKGMFERFFIRIEKEYNQYIKENFTYNGLSAFHKDESESSKGMKIFNNIKENLDDFLKKIYDSLNMHSEEILGELKTKD